MTTLFAWLLLFAQPVQADTTCVGTFRCAQDIQTAAKATKYAIADANAIARDAKTMKGNGEVIPIGTMVTILEEKKVGGRTYVKVQSTAVSRKGEKAPTWWTSKSNLGSPKDFDSSLEPKTKVSLKGLTGLKRQMAILYNTKGGWIASKAKELGVKPEDLAAVLMVEAGGSGFNDDGTPIIRFENHHMWKHWGRNRANRATYNKHFKYGRPSWKGHKFRKTGKGRWGSFHGNQDKEHEVLTFAAGLDQDAAYSSISVGAAQIMGSNHTAAGHGSAKDMYDAFAKGIKGQLEGMADFIVAHPNMHKALKKQQYVTFAGGYNGPGQAKVYGRKIKSASAAYKAILPKRKPGDS